MKETHHYTQHQQTSIISHSAVTMTTTTLAKQSRMLLDWLSSIVASDVSSAELCLHTSNKTTTTKDPQGLRFTRDKEGVFKNNVSTYVGGVSSVQLNILFSLFLSMFPSVTAIFSTCTSSLTA